MSTPQIGKLGAPATATVDYPERPSGGVAVPPSAWAPAGEPRGPQPTGPAAPTGWPACETAPAGGPNRLSRRIAVSSPLCPARAVPDQHPVGSPDIAARSWLVPVGVVIVGMFMSVLDMSIINIAVPAMRADFGESADNIQWVSTSYSLAEGVAVPAAAWLGMRFGLRRVYVWSLAGFTVASALCGLADGLGQMVAFRILQAIPGGVIPVTCLTILFKMVPINKIGAAMGIFGLGVTFAPGAGPSLGGYLVEYLDWRMVFYINVPVGILGVLAALVVLPDFAPQARTSFDVFGFLTVAGGLFSLLLALEKGPEWGWGSYAVIILLAVSANLMALFVAIELAVEHPLLDLRVFTYWPFVNSMIILAVISIGLYTTLFYIPSFLQGARGLTPSHAGLVVAPLAAVLMVMMPVTGQLFDRFGARWLAVLGLLVNGGALMLLSRLSVEMSRHLITIEMMMMAGGMALAMMPSMTGGLSAVPPHLADYASGFNTLIQRISAGLGLAGMTAIVRGQRGQLLADRSGLLPTYDTDRGLTAVRSGGDHALLALWQALGNRVQAQVFGTVFLVSGTLVLVAVALALLLPAGRPSGGEASAGH